MLNLMNRLLDYAPQEKDGRIYITVPMVVSLSQGPLELVITQEESTYTLFCPTNFFEDANESQQFYFDLFKRHFKGYFYDIELKNGLFTKSYSGEHSPLHAINDFIRFIILLDDFMLENDVIGHENSF